MTDPDDSPVMHRSEANERRPREWSPRRRVSLAIVLGIAATVVARHFEELWFGSGDWSFYLSMALCAGFVIYFLGHLSTDSDAERPTNPHPDPDVQAMIQGKIDASEYARRKQAQRTGSGG